MATVEIGIQTRGASLAPSTVDAGRRTVELVWSTGAAVKRMDWNSGEVYIEELSMDPAHIRMGRLTSGRAPLCAVHGRYSITDVLGVVETAEVKGGEGRAVVRFSKRADVDPVWGDVQDGILGNVSVGYNIYKFEDRTERGERHRRLVAVDWEPTEISIVPIGADGAAGIRSAGDVVLCEVSDRCEPAENLEAETASTDQTILPAAADGVRVDSLRLQLDLASREI